jgi:hypothetical protein
MRNAAIRRSYVEARGSISPRRKWFERSWRERVEKPPLTWGRDEAQSERKVAVGDKGKKDKDKGLKQKAVKHDKQTKKVQEKQTKKSA